MIAEAPQENAQAEPDTRRRWLFLTTIALGVLLNPLNSSMISVAMARLEHVFSLNFASASWLISTYYLASAIAQPIMGKVSDLVGRKRVFLTGLVLVAVTSVTAPFSPTFGWLIVLRLIQSVGSGAIYPAGMGIVRDRISTNQAQALAFLAVFSSGAAAFGPSIGGMAMHVGDWKAIFLINIPFILVSFLLSIWVLPKDAKSRSGATLHGNGQAHSNEKAQGNEKAQSNEKAHSNEQAGKPDNTKPRQGALRELILQIDAPGAGLFAAFIITFLLFLLSLTSHAQWWAGVTAIAAGVLFVIRELRTRRPFIDLRMFAQNRAFTWVQLQFMVVNVIFYSVFFGIPIYLQEVRGLDAQMTGLMMLCIAGFGVIVTPITGRWVQKSGSRPPLLLAGLCMFAGSVLVLTWHPLSPYWWLAIVLCVLGVSNGFNNIGLQTALFAVTPKEVIGAASGLFMMARYMGTILSTVILGVFFGSHLSTVELHHLTILLAAIALVVIWMSWRIPKGSRSEIS